MEINLNALDRPYPPAARKVLRTIMYIFLAILVVEVALIYLKPEIGLRVLWFATIPLAPMIILVAPNLWVSVCPLSTVQTLSHRAGLNPPRRLSSRASEILQILGWTLMFLGIPTRHLVFNTVGAAAFTAVAAAVGVGLVLGFFFRSLSAWCMGFCPIRPIEVIYGQFARDRHRPEKCTTCTGCVSNCMRVTPEKSHDEFARSRFAANLAMGFPGFVAAYFLLDLLNWCKVEHEFLSGVASTVTNWPMQIGIVYGTMAGGSVVSWLIFSLLARAVGREGTFRAVAISALAAYYLGVVPEICEAWNWPLWVGPFLLLMPAAAVIWALLPRNKPATATSR